VTRSCPVSLLAEGFWESNLDLSDGVCDVCRDPSFLFGRAYFFANGRAQVGRELSHFSGRNTCQGPQMSHPLF
jgi:hypothetical protein